MEDKRCTYYHEGFCTKGLLGTKCELEGCVAHITKPMKKFSELRPQDDVFVVYNANWNKGTIGHGSYPEEYAIKACKIIENNLKVPTKINVGDRYDIETKTIYENSIKIMFCNLVYGRSYTDFYDKAGEMTISTPFLKNGPWITVFTEKDNAVEYVKKLCEDRINELEDKIKTYRERMEALEKSIENAMMLI